MIARVRGCFPGKPRLTPGRWLLLLSLACCLLLLGAVWWAMGPGTAQGQQPEYDVVTVTSKTTTTVTLRIADSGSGSQTRYRAVRLARGSLTGPKSNCTNVPASPRPYTLTLTGLSPNTTYYVQASIQTGACSPPTQWLNTFASFTTDSDVQPTATPTPSPCAGSLSSNKSTISRGESASLSLSVTSGTLSSVSWSTNRGSLSGKSNSGATITAPSTGSGSITITAAMTCSGWKSTASVTVSVSYRAPTATPTPTPVPQCSGYVSGGGGNVPQGGSRSLSLVVSSGTRTGNTTWNTTAGTLSSRTNTSVTVTAPSSGSGSMTVWAQFVCTNLLSATAYADAIQYLAPTPTPTPRPTAPNKPATPTSSARSATSVTIQWTPPHNVGKPAITGYKVRYKKTAAAGWTAWSSTLGATVRSLEVTGLDTGAAYYFAVAAVSSLGTGAWSDSLQASTLAVPGQVSGLVLTSATKTALSVLWSAPSSPGSTISKYQLAYRPPTVTDWANATVIELAGTITSRTITGLDKGVTYQLRARAQNSIGWGAWSETLFADTLGDLFSDEAPADFVLHLVRTDETSAIVRAEWKPVTDATAYEVERIADDARVTFTTTHLTYTDDFTKPEGASGRLQYRVRAKKTESGADTFSAWSARSDIFYFGAGDVAADEALAAELAGTRGVRPDTARVRSNLRRLVQDLTGDWGFADADASALVNMIGFMPALLLVGGSAYGGHRMRAMGPIVAVGYTIAVLWLFAMVAVIGFPVIWPILLTVIPIIIGILAGVAAIRRRAG